MARALRWARKRSNQELSNYIARFPKAAGKLAANLLRGEHDILKRRHQGRETYSPTGENSI